MSETDVAPGPKVWPSVDNASPKEQGGPIARQGFTYQDEIAVGFLLDMIEDPGLAKIHFETHDDLVLVRVAGAGQSQMTAEFVQVKSGESDKLWSVADICHRKKKDAVGTSILEISIGRDEHEEVAAFRLVTLRAVVSDLAPLTYPFGADGRKPGCPAMTALEAALNERLPGLASPKENGCGYWLKNCFWDVRHDREAVEKANTIRIFTLAQQAGQPLLIEQIEVLLNEMRAWVKAAGDAKWASDKAKKIVPRADAVAWWKQRLAKVAQGADAPSGGALADKMHAAALPGTLIAMAVDLRRSYAAKVRTATYMDTGTAEALKDQVKSRVQSLSAELAAGLIDMDGPQFHARCLAEMETINEARPSGVEDQSAFLKGCLYDIADRCLLRFDRTTL
ncbi:MAG TPA: dsDNA nuclease domain-containing protein [Phenylobacterium sp.]|uniref:dsDNA nuclease domain-containing protein n=1 Tax=Phenylobacterium sp. TaxID=1871053 RepID=UPI002F930E65